MVLNEPANDSLQPTGRKPPAAEYARKQSEERNIPLVAKDELAGKDQKFDAGRNRPLGAKPEFVDTGPKYAEPQNELLAAKPERHNRPSLDEGRMFPKHEEALNTQSWESAWTRRDYGTAFGIATKLDDAGNPAGAYGLGLAYHTGNGADIDEDKAFEAFKKAASLGHGPAQLKLAQAYYHGTGAVRANHRIARHWFEKAADNGVGEAAYNLSVMCKKGQGGLKPDCEQDWLDKSQELGFMPK